MKNSKMKEMLNGGQCIDVSECKRNVNGDYILEEFKQDVDYCDARSENWIWSIGRHKISGIILASTSSKFYMNDSYVCLFLR